MFRMYINTLLLFVFIFTNSIFPQELSVTSNTINNEIKYKIKLQLKWKHQFQFAGYYAALYKGFYANEGIDVSIIEGGRDSNPVENVLQGKVDFGVSDVDLIYERMKGKPLVILAAIFQHSHHVLLAKKNSGIRKPSDLIGKRVMISDYIGVAQLRSIFDREGLSLQSINIIPDRWSFDALVKDSVDMITGYISDHPYRLKKLGIEPFIIHSEDYGIDFYGDMVFTSEKKAKKETDLVKRFKFATIRGWKYALTHQDEVIDYILKNTTAKERGLNYERLNYEAEQIKKIVLYGYVDIGHINEGRIENMAKTLVEIGIYKGKYSLDGFIFDPDKKNTQLFRLLAIIMGAVLLIFILSLIIINQLRKIIKKKTKDLEEEIKQRKNIEIILLENEERYKSIFDNSPLCLIEVDFSNTKKYIDEIKQNINTDLKEYLLNHKEVIEECYNKISFIDINKATKNFFYIEDKNDFLIKPQSYFTLKTNDFLINYLVSISNNEQFFETELALTTKQNEDKIILFRSAFAFDLENINRKMLISLVDITERKQMEKELKINEKKYRNLFLEFRSILDSVPDAIVVMEKNHQITWMNYYAEHVLKYQAIKKSDKYCCKILFDQDLPCDICLIDESAKTKNPKNREFTTKDGKVWEMRTIPIMDDQNELLSIIVIIRDITIKKHAEEEMFKKEKIESVGVLAGGIAHDFNNLLTAVLGNISLSKMMLAKKNIEKIEKYLSSAEQASIRAKDLTYQLLTFSKGGAPIKKITTLKDVIKDSSIFVLRGSKNKINFEIANDLWNVEADSGQISQVIQNLVLNADQSMKQPGTIIVRAENISIKYDNNLGMNKGNYIKISVKDEGIGIPDEIKTKIFDPYFTTKKDGNGLGLAISYSIIKKHQGYITLESEVDKGSEFTIYLPALQSIENEFKENNHEIITTGYGKIMIIDDEEMIRNLLTEILESLGYKVCSFSDAKSALEEYTKQLNIEPFDLVITDLTIPGGMGGKEFLKEVLKYDKNAKVIVSSGYSNDPLMSDYKKFGFKAVISKPYVVEDLGKVVSSVINEK